MKDVKGERNDNDLRTSKNRARVEQSLCTDISRKWHPGLWSSTWIMRNKEGALEVSRRFDQVLAEKPRLSLSYSFLFTTLLWRNLGCVV